MTNGCIYFLCGGGKRAKWRRYLSMLAVSLHSLRQHYDGPVCILAGTDFEWSSIPARFDDVAMRPVPITQVPAHAGYVTKSSLWRHSPFDQSVLLDADTVVTGDIRELFVAPLTATRFSEWVTTGKIVGGRLRQWKERGLKSWEVDTLLRIPHRAINTGVVGWNRLAVRPQLEQWERLTQDGYECSFTDELGLQILWPEFEAAAGGVLLDDRFNCSPTFGVNREDCRVMHFHGRRMVRNPQAGELYRPHLRAALDANFGGIRDWLKELDPALWDLGQ